jgi:hypothetical protein
MPERICTPAHIDDLLARLDEYEKKTGKKAIAAHFYNKALGKYYDVIPQGPKQDIKQHGRDICLGILTRADLLKMQACMKDARYAAREINNNVACALASLEKTERVACPYVDMRPPWNHYLNVCCYAPHQSLATLPTTAEITPEELIKRAEKK